MILISVQINWLWPGQKCFILKNNIFIDILCLKQKPNLKMCWEAVSSNPYFSGLEINSSSPSDAYSESDQHWFR